MGYTLENSTHLDTADRPALGRTTPELAVLFLAVLCAGGLLQQPGVALPLRLAEGAALLLGAAVAVLYRPQGRSLALWAQTIGAYLVAEHRFIWSRARPAPVAHPAAGSEPPPHLAGHLGAPTVPGHRLGADATGATPGAGQGHPEPTPEEPPETMGSGEQPGGEDDGEGASRQTQRWARTQDRPYVPARIAGHTVAFGDGRRLALLECSGPATTRLDADGERALHVALHRALLGWPFPLQVWVWADPLDLRVYTRRREAALAALPPAVRPLLSSDISFMVREARRLEALDLRAFVVVPGPTIQARAAGGVQALLRRAAGGRPTPGAASPEEAEHILADRCARVARGLAAARVRTWLLADDALEDVWYRLLCPRSARLQPLDAGHAGPSLATSIVFPAEGAL